VEKAMQSATIAKIEPPSLAKAGVARKKAARSSWAANTRTEHASRVWSKADVQKTAFGLSDHSVVRPVRTFGRLSAVSPAMQEVF
jgi:hypothetical protein